MNGAELLVDTLTQAGVRRIFSLSGNQIMPVYDACIDAGISIVHVRHESAAVHMADAWAQVTGDVGVALVTAGPGFGNALSALFSAQHSESPVLLLSGDSPVSADGNGAFQELAQVDIARPLVKISRRPGRAEQLGHDTAAAIAGARSGRPGPAHVALPFDVLGADAGDASRIGAAALDRRPRALAPPSAEAIVRRIMRAKRPVVLTGPRMSRSRNGARVAALETALGVPVIAMESPRGLRDPALGTFSHALAVADLVVLLGKAVDFAAGFARPPVVNAAAELVVIDPDDAMIDRAWRLAGDRVVVSACADPDLAADAMVAAAPGNALGKAPGAWGAPGETGGAPGASAAASGETAGASGVSGASPRAWRDEVTGAIGNRAVVTEADVRFHPRTVCEAVQRVLDAASDPVLVCDGGEFGQWSQALCTAPVRIINGLSGAIGGGLCHALAAKLARPEATVVAMMGDGTAGFHFTEFDTAVREEAAFVTVIGNDFRWNAEHQIQLRAYGPDRLIGCDLAPSARYDLAAAGLGCHGEHVTDPAGLDAALARALASGRPACVNAEIDGVAAPAFRERVAQGGH